MNIRDEDGVFPVYASIKNSNIEAVKLLCENKAFLRVADKVSSILYIIDELGWLHPTACGLYCW